MNDEHHFFLNLNTWHIDYCNNTISIDHTLTFSHNCHDSWVRNKPKLKIFHHYPIVFLLKNMANESKPFRLFFKITYLQRIQNILH